MSAGGGGEGDVRLVVNGAVATVTLDRPATLNAQTPATWRALREIGRSLPPDVYLVIVRGQGRAFSSGLDRRLFTPEGLPGSPSMLQIARMASDDANILLAEYQEAFSWLSSTDRVSIAAVHGPAIGAGFQLALACDLRVLADDAVLCMAETTLGLVPDLGGVQSLVSLVGSGRALEMCLTGRRIGATEALQVGLANLVVPTAELSAAVDDLVAALLVPPPAAVVETKALISGAAGRTRAQQLAAERAAQLRRLRDLTDSSRAAPPVADPLEDH